LSSTASTTSSRNACDRLLFLACQTHRLPIQSLPKSKCVTDRRKAESQSVICAQSAMRYAKSLRARRLEKRRAMYLAMGVAAPEIAMLMARLTRGEPRCHRSITCPDRQSGRSSGVEHNLAKVGVEGSNPFARSSFFKHFRIIRPLRPRAPLCFSPGDRRGRVGPCNWRCGRRNPAQVQR
jgi:hypothetical protein